MILADGGLPVSAVALSRVELESAEWAGSTRSVVALECPVTAGQGDDELGQFGRGNRSALAGAFGCGGGRAAFGSLEPAYSESGWRREGPELNRAFPGLFVAGEHMPQPEGQQGVECAVMSGQSAALAALEELEMVND